MNKGLFWRLGFLPGVVCGAILLMGGLAGCEEGSISEGDPAYVGGGRREIDEMELLGSPHGASEADIRGALHGSGGVTARAGTSLMVVQSGAGSPDSIMLAAAEPRYHVFPFNGAPAEETPAGSRGKGALARELRLAAAKSGCTHILCYWGKLETIQEDQVTKTVSWVPIVGNLVPDEHRTTRLRVRGVLIDVASGRVAAFTPPAAQNSALSSNLLRGSSRDKQVYELKTRAYAALIDELAGERPAAS